MKRTVTYAVLLFTFFGCAQKKQEAVVAHSKPATHVWKTDQEFEKLLGNAETIEAFTINPPRSYTSQDANDNMNGATMIGWAGKKRPDGSSPSISLMTVKPQNGVQKPQEEQFHQSILDGIKRRRSEWSQTETEYGTINSIYIIRTKWSGIDSSSGKKMQGVVYTHFDGNMYYAIQTQDIEPHCEEALKLGMAAIHSLKRR